MKREIHLNRQFIYHPENGRAQRIVLLGERWYYHNSNGGTQLFKALDPNGIYVVM